MMSFKKRWIVSCLIGLSAYSSFSLSQASNVPVIDESIRMESDGSSRPAVQVRGTDDSDDDQSSSSSSSSSSLEQRVSRLEKQMSARNQVDAVSQIDELKQEVADLRGQVETLSHQVQQATKLAKSAPSVTTSTTITTPAPAAETTSVADPKELLAYQKGYDAIKAKDFDGAKTAFTDYLQQYKKGVYAGNAHYWLGEIYLHQNSLSKAAAEFNQVLVNSKNPKYPEAMLKLGFIYYQQQNWDQARKQLNLVKQQFPGTTVDSLATAKLQEMTQQGH